MVTKVYRCLESPETAMMEEKLLMSVTGYPELYFFKVFANMTVYLTAKTKDFRALVL